MFFHLGKDKVLALVSARYTSSLCSVMHNQEKKCHCWHTHRDFDFCSPGLVLIFAVFMLDISYRASYTGNQLNPLVFLSFQAVYYVFAILGMMLFEGKTNPSVVGANKTRYLVRDDTFVVSKLISSYNNIP